MISPYHSVFEMTKEICRDPKAVFINVPSGDRVEVVSDMLMIGNGVSGQILNVYKYKNDLFIKVDKV